MSSRRLGSMFNSASRFAQTSKENAETLRKIVRIQRTFRQRQASRAQQAAEEERKIDNQDATTSRANLLELERDHQGQSVARTAEDGTIVFEARTRPRHGPVSFRQYRDQMELLLKREGGSLPLRCIRGQMHPFEPSRVWWDGIIFLLLLYTSVWEPYKAAFLDIDSLSLWDVLVDAVFWVDIFLSFSTGYVTEDGLKVDFHRGSIVKQYCTRPNGFFVDLIATVPWDAVLRTFEPALGMRKPTYRVTRMVRLLRLLRAPRLINRLTEHRNWAVHSVYVDFSKFTIYTVILAHALACIFFLWPALFVSDCSALPNADPSDDEAPTITAIADDTADDCTPLGSWRETEELQDKSAWHSYVLAMYWSVTTITTIGFGDVTPVLQCEIIFTIFAEMFGMAFFALLVDQVVRLSDVLDNHRQEQNECKNQVIQFMNQNGLDLDFRERVLDFMQFRATSASRRSFDPNDPRFAHLSPAILDEMRMRVFRPILRAVALFDEASNVPQGFVDALAMCITSDPFSPEETIVACGAYGNALCIVLTGQVVISKSGVRRRLILHDDAQPVFGVSATLAEREFHMAQTELEDWSAESISYCDIAMIGHDAFRLALAQSWPEGEQVMRRVARSELLRSDGVKMTNALGDRVRSTVWVGNLPERYATESRVKQLMGQFGTIHSATVRHKKGKNKSWSLVTYDSTESAGRALETAIDVYGETETDGSKLYLNVRQADLENALSSANRSKGGAISAVLVKHATETHYDFSQSKMDTNAPEKYDPSESTKTATEGLTMATSADGTLPEQPRLPSAGASSDTDDDPAAYLTDQLISSMPLFQGLTLAERQALTKVLNTESYPDGYAIVNQGESGDLMYILAAGRAVATMTVEVGAPPKTLRIYQSGDYFGELALMSNQPRSASVLATGPVTCFTIQRSQFEMLSFSERFLDVLQKGKDRAIFAAPALTRSPSSKGGLMVTSASMLASGGPRRNVKLSEVKQIRQNQSPASQKSVYHSQDIAAMLLSSSSEAITSQDMPADANAPSRTTTTSDLRAMQERQVRMGKDLEAVTSSVKELREELRTRFDRLEAALLSKQSPG